MAQEGEHWKQKGIQTNTCRYKDHHGKKEININLEKKLADQDDIFLSFSNTQTRIKRDRIIKSARS